jgi:hypothetical protein
VVGGWWLVGVVGVVGGRPSGCFITWRFANGLPSKGGGGSSPRQARNHVTPICYNVGMPFEHQVKNRPTQRQCRWCADHFVVALRPGRPRLYCRVSCRQRAYERRKGLGVLPPSDRLAMQQGGPLSHLPHGRTGYEQGILSALGMRAHALRPAGMSERGERRITLCGVLARPIPTPFGRYAPNACKTCARVETMRPSARPIRVSADLAAFRAILDDVGVQLSRGQPPTVADCTDLLNQLWSAA